MATLGDAPTPVETPPSPGGGSPGQQGALGGGAPYLSIIAALFPSVTNPALPCLKAGAAQPRLVL